MDVSRESQKPNLLKLMELNKTYNFSCKFSAMGIKKFYSGGKTGHYTNYNKQEHYIPSILLSDVTCRGIIVADNLYLNYTKVFRKLGKLYAGEHISFNGKVRSYFIKTDLGVEEDYSIGWPTKCFLIDDDSNSKRFQLPTDDYEFMSYINNQDDSFFLDRS